MHGISLGPADLAASRQMKTTRVGGGHPEYKVLEDPRATASPAAPPISRTCGTTPSPRWSTPAPPVGIKAFYGPFGDISDLAACEQQFRNAFLMGCAGAWSLHPNQIAIAKRVFSPDPGKWPSPNASSRPCPTAPAS
jgi:malyl-CoA/(S)-citramalyl-CoA lyase